jgi:hypothetical protein
MVWTGLPLVGGAAGWLLLSIADWLVNLYWLPLPDWIQLARALGEPYASLVAITAGAAVGLRIAYRQARKAPELTVTRDAAWFKRGGQLVAEFPRGSTTAVFFDFHHLVFLTGRAELGRLPFELDLDELREALLRYDWPWHGGDPYLDEYQTWTHDHPDPGVNELFKKRAKTLYGNDYRATLDLRTALGKLGVIVRDTDDYRQQWRSILPGEHKPDAQTKPG